MAGQSLHKGTEKEDRKKSLHEAVRGIRDARAVEDLLRGSVHSGRSQPTRKMLAKPEGKIQ